jgi:hypothetical protein
MKPDESKKADAGTFFAVIDSRSPRADVWREAFGGDAVEMESCQIGKLGKCMMFKIKVSSLSTFELLRACRVLGRVTRRERDHLYWEALQGQGIWLYAYRVHFATSPEEGRRYWAENPFLEDQTTKEGRSDDEPT